MKVKIVLLLLILTQFCSAQSVIYRDNMESVGRTWKGIPKTLITSGYTGGNSAASDLPASSPLYSSIDSCFRLTGIGLGSSGIEKDTLVYSASGLNSTSTYTFRFKLASIAINPTVNLAAGVDASDYVQVEYSTNGTTFTPEIKIVGGSNSNFPFSSLGSMLKIVNGANTSYTSSTASPLSLIQLNLPAGLSQLSFRIILAANAIGESWLVDDVELIETVVLPVEMVKFEAKNINSGIELTWETSSEFNNDHFILYRSFNGVDFNEFARVSGAGNSYSQINYRYVDYIVCIGVVYYKLRQIDYNGIFKEYNMVALNNSRVANKPKRIINYLGQEVNEDYPGPKIYIYKWKNY